MPIIGTGQSASNDPLRLIDMVAQFCNRTGLRVPTTVMGNSDTQITQIRALIEEEGRALSRRGDWEGLIFEATMTTVASADQGLMTDLATNNFRHIKDETLWDRTTRLPIYGPMTGREWQARQAMAFNGPRYRYRIRGGHLLVNPAATAGLSWAFEYASKNWILNVAGDGQEYFVTDNDETILPGEIVLMGLRWRWKKEKGLDYTQDFADYELVVQDALGHDGGKPTFTQDGGRYQAQPMVIVPAMGWNVP